MKKRLISLLLAGTTFAGGVLVASNFTGTANLTEAQQIASNFNTKALEYIQKAKELETLAQSQNTDIQSLVTKIGELKSLKAELEAQIKDLEENANKSEELETEVTRLTEQLTQANSEIEKANSEVLAHKEAIQSLLDASVFTELNIPEKIDISEALEDTETGAEAQRKYSYEIDVTTNLLPNKQEEGKAKAEADIIPYIESMTLLDNPELIKAVKITVKNSSGEYRYNVVVYTDSSNQSTLDSKLNPYRSEAMTTYKIDNLSASVRN